MSLDSLTHDLAEIVVMMHEPQPPRLEPRHVQEVVDDTPEPLHAIVHGAQSLLLGWHDWTHVAVPKEFQVADNWRHWC